MRLNKTHMVSGPPGPYRTISKYPSIRNFQFLLRMCILFLFSLPIIGMQKELSAPIGERGDPSIAISQDYLGTILAIEILLEIINFLPKKEYYLQSEGKIVVPQIHNLLHTNRRLRSICLSDDIAKKISDKLLTKCIALDCYENRNKLKEFSLLTNNTSLQLACQLGAPGVVRACLAHGLDPSINHRGNYKEYIRSILSIAIENHHNEIVRLLLDAKADPNDTAFSLTNSPKNNKHHASLWYAVEAFNLPALKMLLKHPDIIIPKDFYHYVQSLYNECGNIACNPIQGTKILNFLKDIDDQAKSNKCAIH
jgi:hypothetical protein